MIKPFNKINMSLKETDTEQIILMAAKEVFFKKGYDGARMQEIADEAGMNKALLHYYFRSKDKLFEAIFNDAFQKFIPRVVEKMNSDASFEEKIETFVENYITTIIEVPQIPIFVLTELHRNPERIVGMMKRMGVQPQLIFASMQKNMDEGKIRVTNPRHLLINIIALCVFPFAAKPLLQNMLFDNNSGDYHEFLLERKKEVCQFIINSVKI
jgi:AcrR family transcriptional regulator